MKLDVETVWIAADVSLLIIGLIYRYKITVLPEIIKVLFSYGKCSTSNGIRRYQWVLIPKRYFQHFYVYSTALFTCLVILFIRVYIFRIQPPILILYVSSLINEHLETSVNRTTAITLSVLMLIQSLRRLYESYFISVFNDKSYMSYAHYFAGIGFYTGVAVSILQVSPPFDLGLSEREITKGIFREIQSLSFQQAIGTTFFFWASWHQHKAHKILANLRKDRAGNYVKDKYKIPSGDWFEIVSNPHFTAEIMIYSSLCLITNVFTYTWLFLLSWIIIGQIFAAVMSHEWYLSIFKSKYPRRYIIIPYVL